MKDKATDETERDAHVPAGVSRRHILQLGAALAGTVAALDGATAASAEAAQPHVLGGRNRSETSFDEGWRFLKSDAPGADKAAFDDHSWRLLDLPHDWSIEDLPYATSDDGGATSDPSTMSFQTTPPPPGTPTVIGPFDPSKSAGGASTGYTVGGIGWYRKEFSLPGGFARSGARAVLRFDGIYHNATVWLNGTQVASHPYGYTPLVIDITAQLTRGKNVISIKVDNTAPDTRWYTGAGIYRHTFLTIGAPVRIPDFGVFVTTPTVGARRSVARVAVDMANVGVSGETVKTRVTIQAPNGRVVGQKTSPPSKVGAGASATVVVDVPVDNTSLWSPESPSMYTAKSELIIDRAVVDSEETPFGIRSLVWDKDNGLLINGRQIKVRGACVHSAYGPVGARAFGRAEEREVEILKDAGFNAIRTAHNPPSPNFLDVCDRLGILVWDEAFDKWSGGEFPSDYLNDLTAFIKRDRNHPSIVIWSTGNEVSDPALGEKLHDVVTALDSTRPASQGATPFDSPADPQYQYTDVSDVHYNMTDKIALRTLYPNKPMTQSESWPATIFDDWQFAQQNGWFVGSWVWVGWDYMGESGTGATITAPPGTANLPVFGTGPFPWFQDFQGDIDLIGQRKPQNYWRSVVYGLSPVELFVERPAPDGTQQYAHNWSYYDELQSWTWDVPAGKLMTVHVYTSGDSVTLRVNDTDLQTVTVSDADKRIATFQVPYSAGSLTAVASRSGQVIGTKTLQTVGEPAQLKLRSDVRSLTTGPDELAHVLVEVLDGEGRLVPDAVQRVRIEISGAGSLVAIGNGNPHNLDSFEKPRRFTWHGQALVVLRPDDRPGALRLTVKADGLQSDRIEIPVRR